MRRCILTTGTLLVTAALLTSPLSPAQATAGDGAASPSAALGGFQLGDALEAAIDEQTGAFTFGMAAGGLNLGWDSRRLAAGDRAGLGRGWSFGVGHLDTVGGVRVFPANGGVYAANASLPSGLDGYEASDLRFEAVGERELEARADGSAGAVTYAYTLRELGGTTTYFSRDGDPLASVAPTGQRIDWVFSGEVPHRLVRVVDAEGVVTSLDWLADRVEVRPGANLPGDPERAPWTILLDDRGVTGAVDPLGAETSVMVDDRDLVTRVLAASGTTTEVTWAASSDGAEHVDRVRTVGADDRELSVRTWSTEGESLGSTGWPAFADGRGAAGAAGTELEYTTVIDDGRSRVSSTYNDLHSLIRRVMATSTASGERVLQEQAFVYPSTDERGRRIVTPPTALAVWGKPTAVSVTFHDEQGAARTESERSVFDEFGRQTSRTAADGTITEVEYDRELPEAIGVPIGLPLAERTIAPDGLIDETMYDLNAERTAVVAAERATGRVGAALVPVGRIEYTVEDDGFVSEERAYPADLADRVDGADDGHGADDGLRITGRERVVDLAAGTVTETERIGVGTPAEAVQSRTISLVHGGVTGQTDAAGNRSSATYDQVGRRLTATDAAGRVTTTTHETPLLDGRDATTVTGPDGVAITQERDELGRVTTLTDNIDRGEAKAGFERIAETREYPAPGMVRTTDAWGAATTTERDAFGRVVRSVAPNGLLHVSEHDDVTGATTNGLTATGDLADAEATSTGSVDTGGRVVSVTGTRRDGVDVPAITTDYDGLGREVVVDDGLRTTTIAHDELGRPATTALAPSAGGALATTSTASDEFVSATRDFDGFGTPRSKLLVAGGDRSLGREHTIDPFGRVSAETDQRGVVQTLTYTIDGLVAKAEVSSGATTTTIYDDETRAPVHTIVTSPSGATVETGFEYDPLTDALVAVYDPAARDSTEIRYTYDDFGNTTRIDYPDGAAVAHAYDAHGRLESTTDVAGLTTDFAYDDTGLMTSAQQTGEGARDGGGIAYEYDELGRTTTVTRGNGVVTRYEYTSANEVARELSIADGATAAERIYDYDVHGRLVSRTDRVREPAAETAAVDGLTATTTTYAYDALDRLVRSALHDGDDVDAPLSRATDYDVTVAGDIERETVMTVDDEGTERTTVRAFEYSPVGELLAVTTDGVRDTQQYDTAGNLTLALDGTEYTYDAANRRVAEISDGVTTETAYWADGSRRRLTTTGAEGVASRTEFYWDGDELINDAHAADAEAKVVASYLIGVGRHARTVAQEGVDGQTSYLGTDRHGNTTELTDETGAVSLRYEYADYGTVTTIDGATTLAATRSSITGSRATERAQRNPIQYTGEYADLSGTLHLAARDYDTVTMRFQSMDVEPLRSKFAFGDLNPIMNVDPTGHNALRDTIVNGFLIGLGVVAAIVTAATMVTPVGPAAIAASAGAWGALVGDATSIGIAISLLVDDSFDFINDRDREALSISGTVIGGVSALAGPAFNYLVKKLSAVDPVVLVPDVPVPQQPPIVVPPTALNPSHAARNHVNPFLYPDQTPMSPHELVPLFGQRIMAVLKTIDSDAPFLLGEAGVDAGALARTQLNVIEGFAAGFIAAARTPTLAANQLRTNTAGFVKAVAGAKYVPQQLRSTGGDAWTQQWWANLNRISADLKDAIAALSSPPGVPVVPVKTAPGSGTTAQIGTKLVVTDG
jgi:RHS repeat-associated protein